MTLPPFSPKRLREIAAGVRNRDGSRKITAQDIQEKRTAMSKKDKPSLNGLLSSGLVQKASSFTAKKKPMRKRSPSQKGWVDVAKAAWDKEGALHRCEACALWLGDDFSPTFFHHLLHRGSYRRFKRDPDNLVALCPRCHSDAHEYTIEGMCGDWNRWRVGWVAIHERMLKLRDKANGIA